MLWEPLRRRRIRKEQAAVFQAQSAFVDVSGRIRAGIRERDSGGIKFDEHSKHLGNAVDVFGLHLREPDASGSLFQDDSVSKFYRLRDCF